ncbi:MAG: lytic transglycosylase domain-containing protein [Sulfuricella sp.]|nr:lytic transglycosylase domain-containing protein [Sulfuricella sp.]
MKKIFVALALLGAALPAVASPESDFLAMRDAFRAGDFNRLNSYAPRLKGHVLEPYALYLVIGARLKDTEVEEIRAFAARYPDSYLADRLRADWLKAQAKNQRWDALLDEYPHLLNADPELACYALQARLTQGDNGALSDARKLWLSSAVDLPDSCEPPFAALVQAEMLYAKDVWARLRMALEAGNLTTARNVARYLPPSQDFSARHLDQAAENPGAFLDKLPVDLNSRGGREITLFALYRVARSQTQQALGYWSKLQAHFSTEDQEYLWGQLAHQAARRLEPDALALYAKAGSFPLGSEQLAWKVRAALREQNWNEVLAAIAMMNEADQALSPWRYWKARALKATGKVAAANALLAPLSKEFHYYGQLAAEEMGAALGNPSEAYKPSEEEIRRAERFPPVQRALLLYDLNMRFEATREWNWGTKSMDDRQLLAAAEVAKRNNLLDRAIYTAEKTVQLHDFSLRFPAPHRDVMQEHAARVGLDEAWVYGLIRQESRFIQQAKSTVGASGLMQLMPATARWVAKKLGMRDFRQSLVNQLNTNVALGTYYLKYVLDELDGQPVLATAAYNAGPKRAQRWRDGKPLEGAIYAESIPFSETRGYVQKVMSNAVYYANRFKQRVHSLKEKMGIVPAAGQKGACNGGDERSPTCD